MKRLLVIKLGALGDMVLATGAFQAIRAHHAGDHVVLLTTRAYGGFARASGYFDAVWIDSRPPLWRFWDWLALGRRLAGGGFERVYDLQHSTRSHMYFRLFGAARPEWSGVAPGCSHPHANPDRDAMHTVEREAEQLAMAGIAATPPPDLSWLTGDISAFGLPPGRRSLRANRFRGHRRLCTRRRGGDRQRYRADAHHRHGGLPFPGALLGGLEAGAHRAARPPGHHPATGFPRRSRC